MEPIIYTTDCVNANGVNVFKHKTDIRVLYMVHVGPCRKYRSRDILKCGCLPHVVGASWS